MTGAFCWQLMFGHAISASYLFELYESFFKVRSSQRIINCIINTFSGPMMRGDGIDFNTFIVALFKTAPAYSPSRTALDLHFAMFDLFDQKELVPRNMYFVALVRMTRSYYLSLYQTKLL